MCILLYFNLSVERVVTVLKCQQLNRLYRLILKAYASEFGGEVFKVDASVLFCQLFECKVNSENKFNIT